MVKNALTLSAQRLELATPDRPCQAAQNCEPEYDGEGNQQVEDVHGGGLSSGTVSLRGGYQMLGKGGGQALGLRATPASIGRTRARDAEWATTTSELPAIPRPANQAGIRPATARGTLAAL